MIYINAFLVIGSFIGTLSVITLFFNKKQKSVEKYKKKLDIKPNGLNVIEYNPSKKSNLDTLAALNKELLRRTEKAIVTGEIGQLVATTPKNNTTLFELYDTPIKYDEFRAKNSNSPADVWKQLQDVQARSQRETSQAAAAQLQKEHDQLMVRMKELWSTNKKK